MLGAVPALIVVALLLPIGAGLAGTLLPAFGYLPALGGDGVSLQPWRDLLATPGLAHAVALTLGTGFAATLLSFALSAAVCAVAHETALFRLAQCALPPLLATPHSALAIGFAFLVAPSGWLLRLVSPWPSGFERPPDWATVHDPCGVAMTLGLVLKEAPYLLLMTITALNQIPAAPTLRVSRALGYRRAMAWLTSVFPLIYPQIRLPIYAVLAFSLSVVDVALILGPTNPPSLAVLVLRDFSDPDLARWFPASAGAVLLLGSCWRRPRFGASARPAPGARCGP